jgi:hypothetical protein
MMPSADKVGQDDVGRELDAFAHELGFGLHSAVLEFQAGALELAQHDLGVRGRVLDHQNFEHARSFHHRVVPRAAPGTRLTSTQ